MQLDPASQLNRSACQADFTYTMTVNAIKIFDTGKGTQSVAEDLEAVLRKIEDWHQGSVAGHTISYRNAEGHEERVEWDGQRVRVARQVGSA